MFAGSITLCRYRIFDKTDNPYGGSFLRNGKLILLVRWANSNLPIVLLLNSFNRATVTYFIFASPCQEIKCFLIPFSSIHLRVSIVVRFPEPGGPPPLLFSQTQVGVDQRQVWKLTVL